MNVGETIKTYRSRRKPRPTQNDVAHALGVHPSAVAKWEQGEWKPSRENAQALDDYLEAEGAILAVCGWGVMPTEIASVAQVEEVRGTTVELRQDLDALQQRVEELSGQLADVTAALPSLARRRPERGGRQSG